jgi:hypothetical protein
MNDWQFMLIPNENKTETIELAFELQLDQS